jgi:hypothetical protein
MLSPRFHALTVGPALCSGAALFGQTPSFHPELTFQGSLLAGSQALGAAIADGDGVSDFVVGKRYGARLDDDYDPYGMDIVISMRSETYIFWGKPSSQKHKQ